MFVILLLNVMELLCVVGGALLDRPCMIFHMFCLCFCMSEVMSSFRSLRTGSQVFAFLMLFLGVILCLRVRACNCYASFLLVCCACLPSIRCL